MDITIKEPQKIIYKDNGRYYAAVGRRKTATARVRILPSTKTSFLVNDKDINLYFTIATHQNIVTEALVKTKIPEKFAVTAIVRGGGVAAQAEAIRHGIARALTLYDEELRKRLKKKGFLKRDPRMKERRKFGLKKARKAPQWSKR